CYCTRRHPHTSTLSPYTTLFRSSPRNLDTILRIPVVMQVVLGSATMPVANLMKLGRGAIVPLDHRVGEPVDVVVNGRVIARGERSEEHTSELQSRENLVCRLLLE